MSEHKFPIRDIQFHEEGVREAASEDMTLEETVAVSYHSTALAYLHFGEFHKLDGPAAEREVDGRFEMAVIEDYLLPAKDNRGMTYFQHVFKDQSDNGIGKLCRENRQGQIHVDGEGGDLMD